MNENNKVNKTKRTENKKVTLTIREQTLFEDIIALSRLTDDSSVNVSHLSVLSDIKGHSFSGVISSLKRKGVITTNGHELQVTSMYR